MANEKRIDPLLTMETVGGGGSTAPTTRLYAFKPYIGQKLGQELVDSGIPLDAQHQLNYSNVTREECFQLMGYKWTGWVVLYKDLKGNPLLHNGRPFYRFKPDAGQLQHKNGKKPAKYLSIKDSGCRPYYSPLLEADHINKGKDVIITEGEKGADSLNFHGFPTIGLAGVDCWRDRRSEGMLPELEAINWRNRNTLIMFDSDIANKDSVKRALKALSTVLNEKGANVRVVTLPSDLDGTKNGADDFLVKYGKEALDDLIKRARPTHEKRKYIWEEEPKLTHYIAITASFVFKKNYAFRPDIGLYKWVGTRWELIGEKPITAIDLPLHTWLDHMEWVKRESHHLRSVKDELLTRIKHTEWNKPNLLSFKNGTLNVINQSFNKTHNRKDYLTHSFDFKYDEEAKCPKWIKFINESFDNNQELIELLKAAFKWSICPKDISRPFLMELFFDLEGRKGSGKGTTLEVLKAIAGGKDAIGSLRNDFRDTTLFGLIGKKVAINNDASGHMTDAGIFDSIVSNEEVPVRKLYLNKTEERLGVVVWRAFNDNPTASGGGVEGLGRRMVTFKFPKSATNPDPYLKEKLLDEVAGIFQWCWQMDDNKMFDVLKNRGNIAAVREASIENQLESQPILQFIFEEIAEKDFVERKSSHLYNQYQDWCKDSGKGTSSITKFGKELGKLDGLVSKQPKMDGNYYQIAPLNDFDLGKIFGISTHARLNPPSLKVANPNPPSSNPTPEKGKEESMDTMDSSNTKNSFKDKKENIYIEKDKEETLHTLQPSMFEESAPIGSAHDIGSNDDDPFWD